MTNREESQYIEKPQTTLIAAFTGLLGAFLIMVSVVGIVHYWSLIVQASWLVVCVLIGVVVIGIPLSVLAVGWQLYKRARLRQAHDEIELQLKQEQLAMQEDERRRANEAHDVNLYLLQTRLHADERGNRPYIFNPRTSQVLEIASGQYVQPVPSHLHIESHSTASDGKEPTQTGAVVVTPDIHIPTFAEAMAAGEISPFQRDMLFSYELLEDEVTRQIRGISPIRGEIGSQHTQFIVAGSQSGKTTYMSGIIAQAIAMQTVLYIIDPHKTHPEKSLAAKLSAFQNWMILPPASTHDEIKRLLQHATKTRDALISTGKRPYGGYHIMVVVDEVPALMQYQRSQDKAIRQLYLELAMFMQSMGIATAKYGMTGLYASQMATKESLGEVDFRDACMSQLVMRLAPNQAQAMRILGKERVNAIPKFSKGHGYLLLADSGDVLHVASGNVTQQDLTVFANQLPASPLVHAVETSMKQPVESGSFIAESGSFTDSLLLPETATKLPLETASQATYKRFKQLKEQGFNQAQIIWKLFHVQAGATQAYKEARSQYLKWQAQYQVEQEEKEAWQ